MQVVWIARASLLTLGLAAHGALAPGLRRSPCSPVDWPPMELQHLERVGLPAPLDRPPLELRRLDGSPLLALLQDAKQGRGRASEPMRSLRSARRTRPRASGGATPAHRRGRDEWLSPADVAAVGLLAPAYGTATGLLLPAREAVAELRALLPASLVITHCALLASGPGLAREGWQEADVCNGGRLKTTLLVSPTCKWQGREICVPRLDQNETQTEFRVR
jgi:hypothetical protein